MSNLGKNYTKFKNFNNNYLPDVGEIKKIFLINIALS